jgi:hypothetical protein
MNRGSTWLIGLVIVVVVGAGAWFAAQSLLVPVLDKPTAQKLLSPIAYSAIQELTKERDGETQPGTSDGNVYTSESEGFSVAAEGEPEVLSSTTTAAGVTITEIQTIWTGTDNAFFVGTADLSAYQLNPDDVIAGSVDGMVSSTPGATLRSSAKTTFLGETATSGVIDAPGGVALSFVSVIHKQRMYIIIASEVADDRDENFIASFKFLD